MNMTAEEILNEFIKGDIARDYSKEARKQNTITLDTAIKAIEVALNSRKSYAESLAKERAEKFDDVKKEITRLQEKYDENGYDFSPLIKLLRIESIIDSVINTYANKLDTFLSDKTKEEEK